MNDLDKIMQAVTLMAETQNQMAKSMVQIWAGLQVLYESVPKFPGDPDELIEAINQRRSTNS